MVLSRALLALLPVLLSGSPDSVVEGKRFRIICHFENEAVAKEALATAEAVWNQMPIPKKRQKKKIVIHLYRTAADYRAAELAITKGRFARNNAFSSHERKEAHIALEPDMTDPVLARIGLPAQTRRQIAHEGAHLVVYHQCATFREHPLWFAEGVATLVADRVLVTKDWSPGSEASPFSSKALLRAKVLLEEGRLPAVTEILESRLDQLGHYERYAVWWTFFRVLTERRFSRLCTRLTKAVWESASPEISEKEAGRLEKAYREHVAALKPEWDELYRSLDVRGDIWIQTGFPDTNAIAWRKAPAGQARFSIDGAFEVLRAGNPQMNLLLGRGSTGFVSVAFRAGDGVTVFRYGSARNVWEQIGRAQIPDLPWDRPVPFSVRVDGDDLTVRVDGKTVVTAQVEDRDLAGPWGVGVQATGAGIWHAVEQKEPKEW